MIAARATAGGQLSRDRRAGLRARGRGGRPSTTTCRSSPAWPRVQRTLALRRLAEQVTRSSGWSRRLSLLEAEGHAPAPASSHHGTAMRGARPPARRPRGGPRRAAHDRSGRRARDRHLSPSGISSSTGPRCGRRRTRRPAGRGRRRPGRRRSTARAGSTPSARSSARPATTRPAAALSTTMSRCGPGVAGEHPLGEPGVGRRVAAAQVGQAWPGRGRARPGRPSSVRTSPSVELDHVRCRWSW